MSLSMTIIPTQKQQLSQHLILQMKLLQMNSDELDAYVAKEVEQNPLLDFPEPIIPRYEEGSSWRSLHIGRKAPDEDDSLNPLENTSSPITTLADFLEEQIGCLSLSHEDKRIAYYIIGTLEPSGYWHEDPQKAAEHLGVTKKAILSVLYQIQQLEPCGVGARSLKECLLLQLDSQKEKSDLARKIVQEGLEELAQNKIPQLAAHFSVTKDAVLEARNLIRRLNPKPGAAYNQSEPVEFLHEDIYVKVLDKGLQILFSSSYGKTLIINKEYMDILDHTDRPKVKKYLKKELNRARNLQRLLKNRDKTLSLVLEALVTHQEAFFRYGPGHKIPLKLTDLAEETGFAISTVSRALSHKVIACRWGAFAANSFLVGTTAKSYAHTGKEVTEEALIIALKKLIKEEDKHHPLSDQALCERLNASGISVARRTVNKYRTKLGIPEKSARKIW
jgi:RNA polymerase sigma-54 factor